MTCKSILSALIALILCAPLCAQEKIKVACVGNSVTYGYKVPNRETNAYPARLQTMLGEQFEVQNFGHSGATLLRKGHRPYMSLPEFKNAMAFQADLVVIHLGLNDTDPRNWPNYRQEFVADYHALIDSMRVANPKAKIWICRMTPISHDHRRYLSGTRDWHAQIQKAIEQVAKGYDDIEVIDLFEPFHARYDLFPDALHPEVEGAEMLAKIVYAHLTGDFGGLQMPTYFSDNMVVQRDAPIAISGKANAGERIKVAFAGKKQKTEVAKNGTWQVTFDSMPAGGPYELCVYAQSDTLKYTNVWLGDVWVCSGQSNMEFPLSSAIDGPADAKAKGNNPRLHLFHMQPITTTYDFQWDEATCAATNRNEFYKGLKWTMSDEQSALKFSAIAFHFGQVLTDSLSDVHVGLVLNAVGGSTTESWIDRATLEYEFPQILYQWTKGDFGQEWARQRAMRNISASKNPMQRHPFMPHYLFDAGMRPLKGMACNGVLWYQGESNAHNVELHENLFELLQKSWRKFFEHEDLPFYMVQLSSIAPRHSWPHFRDSQRRMAKRLPHTYMAVSSDVGDSLDVHPRNKKTVGQRLALSSLKHTYQFNLTASGPEYVSYQCYKNKVVLQFAHADGLKTRADQAPCGFEIAAEDGLFYPAQAVIKGTTVVVSSPSVKQPRYVRYAWTPFANAANLINGAGLPASTFTTEEF
jgi:sialate O-acetylesterase